MSKKQVPLSAWKEKKLYLQLKLYIALLTMYLKQQGETVNFFSIQYYVYTNVKIFIEALTNKTKEVTPAQRKFWFLFPHIVSLLFVSYSEIYNNNKKWRFCKMNTCVYFLFHDITYLDIPFFPQWFNLTSAYRKTYWLFKKEVNKT